METTNNTISNNSMQQDSSSETNLSKKSKLNGIQQEHLFNNPVEEINRSSRDTLKDQIGIKFSKNNGLNSNTTLLNTNLNFLYNMAPHCNDSEGNNGCQTKWNTISNPLNLSTSSSISSDENRLFKEDTYSRVDQKFSSNTFNLFSTFPFVHTTNSSLLDNVDDSMIS